MKYALALYLGKFQLSRLSCQHKKFILIDRPREQKISWHLFF